MAERKIRVIVDFPWAGVPNIEEDYDLPEGWDEMTEKQQDALLIQYAVEELSNSGVGSGASVVEVDE
jgi:hypothetical protein